MEDAALLTDEQKQILEDICAYQAENEVYPTFRSDMRNLLLVVLGEKKAVEIGLSSIDIAISLVDIVKSILFHILPEKETEEPEELIFLKRKLDELGLEYTHIEHDCLAISKDAEHLEKYPKKKQNGEIDHQSFGTLLGYPETSVNYFASNSNTHSTETKQFIESETPWASNDRYNQLRFINYIPAPNHTSIQRAIETSVKRKELFEKLDVSDYPKLKVVVDLTLENYEEFMDPSPSEYYGD